MSKEDKRFFIVIACLALVVIILVIAIIVVANKKRAENPDAIGSSGIPVVSQEEFEDMSREERTDYFLLTLWGENYEERVFNQDVTPSPFPSVDFSRVPISTKLELELISYTVVTLNPSLLLHPDSDTTIEIVDGVKIDVQNRKDTYTGIQYQLVEDGRILVSGHRNGEPFRLTFERARED